MREIRQLDPSHIDAYADIAFNAYPSFKDFSQEAMASYKEVAVFIMENDPVVTFYGMFEDDELIAVMRLFDFDMNCFGQRIPVSGLGFLGVHLMHKKKGVAKSMVDFYENHYRQRQIPIGILLPFRPDFYKRMGYGLGTKMNQYRIPAARIPAASKAIDGADASAKIRYVTPVELDKLLACHERAVDNTHGMMAKFGDEIRPIFGDPFNRVVGIFDQKGTITGYMVYQFENAKEDNYTITNVNVQELIYTTPADLKALLGFLRTQEDQINLVVINTEDEHFYHLFDDPRNDSLNYIPYGYLETNTQAIGAMYKVFDVGQVFKQCAYRNYNGENITIKFVIRDNYKGELLEEISVAFVDGLVSDINQDLDAHVTMAMTIADFSTLFLGITSVYGLANLGLLTVDNHESIARLDRMFYYHQKPVCYTDF